ncbi:MAG: nucleotidyl transferase AbiEii/AbiGii toxin family protein [Planctomycetota bacterium]
MFQQVIIKVARALDKARIPYMIIGGQAVLIYGEPRLTRDIDITLGADTGRLPDLMEAVKEAKLTAIPKDYRSFAAKTMVLPVRHKATGIRVDFIFSFTPYEKQAIKRSKKIKIGRSAARFASLEDIIIHKIFAGRARDIEDCRTMMIKHPDFDRSYIRKWLNQFDKLSESPHCLLKTFTKMVTRII